MAAEAGGILDTRNTMAFRTSTVLTQTGKVVEQISKLMQNWPAWVHIRILLEKKTFITNEGLDAAAVRASRTAHVLLITKWR